jgi:serine/threonine protein kinase
VASLVTPPRNVFPPRLGRYVVRAKIGDGGMASVFLGHPDPSSPHLPRLVALKVIKEEFCKHPEFVRMFLDEANIISRLSHPNLVQVVELGSEGDRLFIAMELLLGQSLWEVWNACRARGVRLRYDLIAWVGARVAEGLYHAHEMQGPDGKPLQLVHRDVNQSNIFLTYDGQVKVIDFGLAKARGRGYETAGGVVKGKIAYLAPEQVAGQPIDRRADVFALGTTLWELTTDRRLFRAKDDAETLRRIYSAEVPDPTTLVHGFPPTLWEILRRALAREASARYASALDFARSLDHFAQSEGRVVRADALAEVMGQLFAVEHRRDQEWLAEASAADHPAPLNTMHPTPLLTLPPPAEPRPVDAVDASDVSLASALRADGNKDEVPPSSGWPKGAPPDGMFSPAPSRPVPDPPTTGAEATKGPTPFVQPSEAPVARAKERAPVPASALAPSVETPPPPARPEPAPARQKRILFAALVVLTLVAGVAAHFLLGP